MKKNKYGVLVLFCEHSKKIFLALILFLLASHSLLHAEENYEKTVAAWNDIINKGDADFETKQKAYIFFNNYGQKLYEKKLYKEAIKQYNYAVSIFSLNSVSLVNRGNVFISLKSYVKAEEDFKNALIQKPSFIQALYGMGLVMYYGGKFPEAYYFFSRLLHIAPDFSVAKVALASTSKSLDPDFSLGMAELSNSSYRKAYSLFSKVLMRKHDNPVVSYYVARTLFEMGLYRRAVVTLSHKTYNEKLYPENTFLLGKAYFMSGDYDNAHKCFSRLAGLGILEFEQEQKIKYYTNKIPVLTSDNFRRAYKLFNERDYHASLTAFESIVLQPDTPSEVYFYIGKSYINLNLPKKALLYFQKAIQLDANRNDFLFAAANALCFQGKVKLSTLMLKGILATSPYHMPSLTLLGKVNTRKRLAGFLAGIDTGKWFNAILGNVSVESMLNNGEKVASYASRFTSFLDKKFNLKNSNAYRKNIYRIKIFKTRKMFEALRDALGEEYMYENFIFYSSPVPGKTFIAAYRDSYPYSYFLKNLRHAIFHQYLRNFVLNPPSWLDEGLASFVEYVEEKKDGSFAITPNKNRMAALKMMFMAKQYYNLGIEKLLEANKSEFMASPQVYYQEGYAFCRFLIQSSGLSELMSLLRTYASEEENSMYLRAKFNDGFIKTDANFELYVMNQPFDKDLEEGLVLYKRGKWDGAISKFKISFDKDPFLTENLLYLGLALFKKKKLDRAFAYFTKYMELERDRTSSLVFIAAIHKARGETELCNNFLSKATKFEPSNPLVIAMKHDIEGGRKKLFMQTTTHGMENIAEQLDYASFGSIRDARVANNTGVYFFNSGIYDKAVQKFLEVLDIQKDFAYIRYNLGVAYVFTGKSQDAINCLIQASQEFDEKNNKVFLYLSRAYSQVNNLEKAEMYLDKYKKMEEKKHLE